MVQQIRNGITRDNDYYTWEISAIKRPSNHWSLIASFSNLWSRVGAVVLTPNDLINTTNGRDYFSEWQVRISSTLTLPAGVELSPMYRGQAGAPYAPTFTTRLNYNSGVVIKAGLRADYAADVVHVFDLRAQKVFRFGRDEPSRHLRPLQHPQRQRGAVGDHQLRLQLPAADSHQRSANSPLRSPTRVLECIQDRERG